MPGLPMASYATVYGLWLQMVMAGNGGMALKSRLTLFGSDWKVGLAAWGFLMVLYSNHIVLGCTVFELEA